MITYSMLKNIHETLLQYILKCYNRISREGVFSAGWPTAIIIPIQKPGKDSKELSNYQPISLTSCLCKRMEKIINSRLMWYLEKNGHLDERQTGYRKKRSTMDQITQLENDIQQAVANRKHTTVIKFDLSKAYDIAWQHGILEKLHTFGMRGSLPKLTENFMKNRKVVVRIGNTMSQEKDVSGGIPQRSVLFCACFIIAMNGIGPGLPDNVRTSLYVDDFAIYASGSHTRNVERQLQIVVRRLEEWSNRTGLMFSSKKTASIHVCRKRGCIRGALNLTFRGRNISNVKKNWYIWDLQ